MSVWMSAKEEPQKNLYFRSALGWAAVGWVRAKARMRERAVGILEDAMVVVYLLLVEVEVYSNLLVLLIILMICIAIVE